MLDEIRFTLRGVLLCTGLASGAVAFDHAPEPQRIVRRVAFGSCNSPLLPSDVWDSVLNAQPDVWIWLGDTVYADQPAPRGDTPESKAGEVLQRMEYLYARQNAIPAYAELRKRAPIIGTWDDHDYGINDAGVEFVGKDRAQQRFLDFYGVPADSPRRRRPGVYSSYRYGPEGRRVQVIILDTRYFRSALAKTEYPRSDAVEGRRGSYQPVLDPAATFLGNEQWQWLEQCLRGPADVRLLVSSIQVVADEHRFEKWGNLPAERRRLLKLIKDTGAGGVIILSGDRHRGELSIWDPQREDGGAAIDPGYPIHDLTSSGLHKSRATTFDGQLNDSTPAAVSFVNELNRFRHGSLLGYNHFGQVSIDWEKPEGPEITLSLLLDNGEEVLRHRVSLAALRPNS